MVWIILIIVAALVVWFITIRNGIITKRNRCDNAWETIDTQLQRRNDLIPNLVETVKGYAKHESDTLQAVTNARAAVAGATTPEDKMAASNALSGTLKTLFAVSEAYPDLKADANFRQLQTQLQDTEEKLSYARMSFNDCVLEYNNAIETFPGSLVAGSSFQRKQGFTVADESARQAPQVKF